ncbi:ERV/ALR sulfhydryl oxidase domain-containing protein [Xylariomycetidae sp. FL0641]|nr:ERV/ALR sulfhydryl oxidase domain-containing protein [Xylariomycetidae sp. FL0641]
MARNISIFIIVAIALFVFISFRSSFSDTIPQVPKMKPAAPAAPPPEWQRSDYESMRMPIAESPKSSEAKQQELDVEAIPSDILTGGSIAPKLENATIKAELGRASWKLFHTMMARFPEEPTEDDSLALKTYIHLFARLYPCGDCASHFRKLLAKFPPQTSSRNAAAGWACHVHNQVNERLEKPMFDCNKIGDFYDCGCGDEEKKESSAEVSELKLEKDSTTTEMDE